MDVRIVICGLGRVGRAFVRLLIQKDQEPEEPVWIEAENRGGCGHRGNGC